MRTLKEEMQEKRNESVKRLVSDVFTTISNVMRNLQEREDLRAVFSITARYAEETGDLLMYIKCKEGTTPFSRYISKDKEIQLEIINKINDKLVESGFESKPDDDPQVFCWEMCLN